VFHLARPLTHGISQQELARGREYDLIDFAVE
jgi:hypothetical protein